MKKWDGLVGRMLSGVALIGLLSLFAVQEASAATDVYLVRPQANTHHNGYNYVSQSFVAVCDSVTKIAFFLGQKSGSSNYQMEIDSAGIAKGGVLTLSAAGADDYAENEGTYGSPVPVKRGYTYTLKFSRQSGIETVDFYYVADSTYPWGTITYPAGTGDLCGRVVGRIKFPSDYWGMNIQMGPYDLKYDTQLERDSASSKASQAGIKWDREFVNWAYIETLNGNWYWARYDSAVDAAINKGIKVVGCLTGTPKWARSIRDTLYPDSSYPPKRLYHPVKSGNQVDTTNWYADYVYQTLSHFQNRIKVWEVWNEPNLRGGFTFPDTADYHWGADSCSLDSLAKLYVRMCAIVDTVADIVDPTNTVLVGSTSGVTRLWWDLPNNPYNETGYNWLKRLYRFSLSSCGDGICIHPFQFEYAGDQGQDSSRFKERRFHQDVDSVRVLMERNGGGGEPLWLSEVGWSSYDSARVRRGKQADNLLKCYVSGIGDSAVLRSKVPAMCWWDFREDTWDTANNSNKRFGVVDSVFIPKPAYYAYKQMTGKLNNQYLNRRVTLSDTNVYCYEFQIPGSDTTRKTWVVWRTDAIAGNIKMPVRTTYYDTVKIAYTSNSDSLRLEVLDPAGYTIFLRCDSVPLYVQEAGTPSRPDVIVDSLYTYPSTPRAGDYVFFYARLKNIGNATLAANLGNAVKFQVDGVTQKKYTDNREIMKDSTIIVGFNPYPPPGDGSIYDWKATWGDHLIRAWVDSSDKYVELREDNNQGYLFKHIQPKVSLIINNNHKYSNHLANDTLTVVINGNTSPLPDSAKLLHEGSWTTLGVYGSRDTLVTFNGNGVKYDTVIVFQGADRDTAGDSIIVDVNAPYTAITSPPDSQTVNLNAQVEFYGFSYDFEDHDSLWEIWENAFVWADSNNKVGNPLFMMPGYFGTWTAWSTGWHTHTLVSRDSATNIDTSVVHVYVYNSGGGDGDGFGAGFGSFSSAPMNVTTDPNGNLFVAETQNSKVRKYSPKKDSLFAFSARRSDSTGLNWAVGMALKDSTILYVADGYNHCLKAFDRQGNLLLRFGTFGTDTTQFKQPCGIALDWKDRLWVTDRLNHRIQVFDTTGHFLFQFGSQGQDSGKFNSPTGIAINKYKQAFVSDTKNQQIQVFDSLGNWKKTVKQPDSLGFDTPTGICSDKHGNLFIADTKHNRIVELNPFGKRLFIFGKEGDSLCQFKNPIGVASSPGAHYLYVADMGNKRVSRFWVIRGDTLGGGGPQSGELVRRIPKVYSLAQSYPNPTTGEAQIEYGLPKESPVRLTVYNVAGQVVREFKPGKQEAGFYTYRWDGRSNLNHKVGAGVYFYRLEAGSWVKTRKMIVIR